MKQKIYELSEKISKFERSKKSDFSDLKDFLKIYLNTETKSGREKLGEKFRERYLELYDFLKKNPELISAENEISKISSGDFSEKDCEKVTNFFEIIGGNSDDI